MKKNNMDINNKKNLEKLRESLNKVIDNRIEKAELNENIKNIDKFNFGSLKNLFENVSEKLYETQNGKKLIGKYVNVIKENGNLRKSYTIYESIYKPKDIKNTELYTNEIISLSNINENVNNYNNGLKKLRNVLKNCVFESKISSNDFNEIVSKENKKLNESINFLLTTKKNAKNINERVENLNNVIEYINENKQETVSNNNEIKTINDVVTEDLNVSEKECIEKITLYNLNGKGNEKLFEDTKEECLKLIEETVSNEEDTETKSRLLSMKDKLTNKKFLKESEHDDLLMLFGLKNTLK